MNEYNFDLTVKFDGAKMTDEQLNVVAEIIAVAIAREANNYGLAPEDSDSNTKQIRIQNSLNGFIYTENLT